MGWSCWLLFSVLQTAAVHSVSGIEWQDKYIHTYKHSPLYALALDTHNVYTHLQNNSGVAVFACVHTHRMSPARFILSENTSVHFKNTLSAIGCFAAKSAACMSGCLYKHHS